MRALGVALALACATATATAQLPTLLPAGSYIMDRWYPKVFWTARDGFTLGGYFSLVAPLRYSEYDAPPPQRAAVGLDGQASTSGTRFLRLDAWAPYLWPGWRFRVTVAGERWNRDPFYGVGPDLPYDGANTDGDEFFYTARRKRTWARFDVQRQVATGLRVLVGAHAERWQLDALSATSVLGQLQTTDPVIGTGVADVAFRGGLVYDTRDNESVPRHGVLLEAIHAVADADVAGDETYTRTLVSARAYVPLAEQWAVSARVAGQHMGGTPSVGALYLIDQSDEPMDGLGGSQTHRALFVNRLLGREKLWANLDLQFTPFEIPTLARLVFVGFLDAGRVFQTEDLRITTEGLQVGGGGGFLFNFFRNAVLGMTLGGGPDGLVLQAHTRWPY